MPAPDRLQVLELKVPVELVVKLTTPVGATTVPGALSVTVAVHTWSKAEPVGAQLKVVKVGRCLTVTVEVPLLAR